MQTVVSLSATLEDALDEIELRFISTLADRELTIERLYFHLQQAHWYFIDFLADPDRGIPALSGGEFRRALFERSPSLNSYYSRESEFTGRFKEYLSRIPSHGGILLDDALEHILLIRPWYGKTWGLPKGKISENETAFDAAVREVEEEVGFDMHDYVVDPVNDFLVSSGGEGVTRMYVATGVPLDYPFEPQTRKEVAEIAWFRVEDLGTSNKFWSVKPFLQGIYGFISARTGKKRSPKKKPKPAEGGGGGVMGALEEAPVPAGKKAAAKAAKKAAAAALEVDTNAPLESAAAGEVGGRFSVEDMFAANEKLLGRRFVYDGSPHTFGDAKAQALVVGPEVALQGKLNLAAVKKAAAAPAAAGPVEKTLPKAAPAPAPSKAVRSPLAKAALPAPIAPAIAPAIAAAKAAAKPFKFDMGPILAALSS